MFYLRLRDTCWDIGDYFYIFLRNFAHTIDDLPELLVDKVPLLKEFIYSYMYVAQINIELCFRCAYR